jgi:hypothetical protein
MAATFASPSPLNCLNSLQDRFDLGPILGMKAMKWIGEEIVANAQ